MLAIDYLATLVATITIELCVALFLGYRSPAAWRTIVVMNLITHPLLTYILWMNAYLGFADRFTLIAILEIAVVFIEWGLLYFVLRDKPRRLLFLSFAANASSFGAGLLVFGL
jgi:hypothetical protein